MNTTIKWAYELSSSTYLPVELEPVARRVELVEEFERRIMAEYLHGLMQKYPAGQFHHFDASEKSLMLKIVGELSARYIQGVSEADRTSVALRMWAGCVMAGKTIAMQTRDGPNTETDRLNIFANGIDPMSRRNAISRAGVEAAPEWKAGRREQVSYAGVPSDSPVRRFV